MEAVADAQHEVAVVDERAEGGLEVVDELVGENFAGSDVVAVGEAAGKGEDLVVLELGGVGEEGVDVEGVDGGADELEGVDEFAVAVGAGGAEEEDFGGGGFGGHGGLSFSVLFVRRFSQIDADFFRGSAKLVRHSYYAGGDTGVTWLRHYMLGDLGVETGHAQPHFGSLGAMERFARADEHGTQHGHTTWDSIN